MDRNPEWCLTTTVGRGDLWFGALRALLDRFRQRSPRRADPATAHRPGER